MEPSPSARSQSQSAQPFRQIETLRANIEQVIRGKEDVVKLAVVALLAKGDPSEPFFTRAICGFEPEWLSDVSLKSLTEYIVIRHFRIGIGDGF